MTGPLVDVLAMTPGLRAFIAEVLVIENPWTVAIRVGGGYGGGQVSGVRRLASYTNPTPGDVVYVLASPTIGMVILGREEFNSAALPPAVLPGAAVQVVPASRSAYSRGSEVWTGVDAVQDADSNGAFIYDTASFSPLIGTRIAALDIQLQPTLGTGQLEMMLITNTTATGVWGALHPHYFTRTTVNELNWVGLPLAWADKLVSGAASGVGLASDLYNAGVVNGGTLRITPL